MKILLYSFLHLLGAAVMILAVVCSAKYITPDAGVGLAAWCIGIGIMLFYSAAGFIEFFADRFNKKRRSL